MELSFELTDIVLHNICSLWLFYHKPVLVWMLKYWFQDVEVLVPWCCQKRKIKAHGWLYWQKSGLSEVLNLHCIADIWIASILVQCILRFCPNFKLYVYFLSIILFHSLVPFPMKRWTGWTPKKRRRRKQKYEWCEIKICLCLSHLNFQEFLGIFHPGKEELVHIFKNYEFYELLIKYVQYYCIIMYFTLFSGLNLHTVCGMKTSRCLDSKMLLDSWK